MEFVRGLVNRLVQRDRDRGVEAQKTFGQLVRSIADGKTVTDDEAERILAAAGLTGADLQAAVELLLRRRVLAEKIKERGPLEAQLRELDQQQEESNARLLEARERANREGAQIAEKRDAIETALGRVKNAERELKQTAGTLHRHQEIGEEIVRLRVRIDEALERAAQEVTDAERARGNPNGDPYQGGPDLSRKLAAAQKAEGVGEMKTALAAARRRLAELTAGELTP